MKEAYAKLLLCLQIVLWLSPPPEARPVPAIAAYRLDDSASHPPALLSATGLYRDLSARPRALTDSIHPYAVNAPSWNDGARKDHFVSVPFGSAIVPTDSDNYRIPDGTVFIENLSLDTIAGDTSSRILIETRFLTVSTLDAYPYYSGLSYRWRRDQSDADLVPPRLGADAGIGVRVGGLPRAVAWRFPTQAECNRCHVPVSRGAPGFITPQLNRPSLQAPGKGQLQELADLGALAFNPAAGKPDGFRWRNLDDTGAGLEPRARSYLAANCSHCHGNAYNNHAVLSFEYFNPAQPFAYSADHNYQGYLDRPRDGDAAYPRLMYAGRPDSSFILKRLLSRGTPEKPDGNQMPPLGTYRVDSAGVNLLRDWLCGLGEADGSTALDSVKQASACRLPDVDPVDPFVTGLGPRGARGNRSESHDRNALPGALGPGKSYAARSQAIFPYHRWMFDAEGRH